LPELFSELHDAKGATGAKLGLKLVEILPLFKYF
jgi:hypothetical protein